jgi:hypothetical protein
LHPPRSPRPCGGCWATNSPTATDSQPVAASSKSKVWLRPDSPMPARP